MQKVSEAPANPVPDNSVPPGLIAAIETAGSRMRAVRDHVGQIIFGQEQVVEQALVTLLAGGHALLVGMPGLAKTRLVETLGVVLGLEEQRVQFTPDLMPADILGSEVLEESDGGRRAFRFIKGPVFCQLLMADEINRASPRTQSALLQAMQERQVSIAGHRHQLPAPFHVLATQNPLEQEGTYPLPEAQLDRFLMQIDVDYPDAAAERRMLLATTGPATAAPQRLLSGPQLIEMQGLVRQLPVGERIIAAILDLVRSSRDQSSDFARLLSWAPGPRASQALMLGVRARALLAGRLSPSEEDIVALAPSILRHRMALTFAARADGIGINDVIARMLKPLQ
jgi:MoxR-like ATPase